MPIISVEGNIGAGKSSALAHLALKCPHITVLQERVDDWSFEGVNLLTSYASDPARWAYLLQKKIIMEFRRIYIDNEENYKNYAADPTQFLLLDRNAASIWFVFVKVMHERNYLTDAQVNELKKDFDTIPLPAVSKSIYVRTDYLTCHERAVRRGRRELNSRRYLAQIEFYHDAWLTGCPIVNGNNSISRIATDILGLCHDL